MDLRFRIEFAGVHLFFSLLTKVQVTPGNRLSIVAQMPLALAMPSSASWGDPKVTLGQIGCLNSPVPAVVSSHLAMPRQASRKLNLE